MQQLTIPEMGRSLGVKLDVGTGSHTFHEINRRSYVIVGPLSQPLLDDGFLATSSRHLLVGAVG